MNQTDDYVNMDSLPQSQVFSGTASSGENKVTNSEDSRGPNNLNALNVHIFSPAYTMTHFLLVRTYSPFTLHTAVSTLQPVAEIHVRASYEAPFEDFGRENEG